MNINLTLIGQLIAFVAFVAFCMRYVWPPIAGAMAERQNKIADGLAAADRAGHDLEVAKQQADEQLAEAKREAAASLRPRTSAPKRWLKRPKTLRVLRRIGSKPPPPPRSSKSGPARKSS